MKKSITLSKNNGFVMIEVLVTALLITIGLVGFGGLMAHNFRAGHSSLLSTRATTLAESMAERIKANYTAAREGTAYDNLVTPGGEECSGICADGAAQAQDDLYKWSAMLGSELPLGKGKVEAQVKTLGSGIEAKVFVISVLWDADKAGISPTRCEPSQCVSLTVRM